jgi:hypothetical protein
MYVHVMLSLSVTLAYLPSVSRPRAHVFTGVRFLSGSIASCVQSIANLRTRQAHQLGCFVYTEGIFAPKLCGQVVDVFLDRQL